MPGVLPAALAALAAPTPDTEVRQRQGPGGKMLDYIDARFVYDRLDTEVGPENWQTAFQDSRFGNAIRGGIGILIDMGDVGPQWVWKWDVGVASDIEPEKGAHSEAIKRAAVHWGIARDLYSREPQPAPGFQQQAPQPQQQRPPLVQRGQGQPQVQTAGQGQQSPWVCPQHGTVKVVPGGVSKRTGNPYDPFFSCTEQNCNQKPPRGLAVPAWMLQQQPVQQQYAQPPAPSDPMNYSDGNGEPLPY